MTTIAIGFSVEKWSDTTAVLMTDASNFSIIHETDVTKTPLEVPAWDSTSETVTRTKTGVVYKAFSLIHYIGVVVEGELEIDITALVSRDLKEQIQTTIERHAEMLALGEEHGIYHPPAVMRHRWPNSNGSPARPGA